jgi:hypothetical protein
VKDQGFKWKAKSNDFHDDQSRPEDPCSHWYPGNRPFQAPEVNNMENYFRRLPRLKGFLDLRSYGQMRTSILTIIHSSSMVVTYCSIVSTPFSYSCKKTPKDAEDQLEAISGAAFAMKKSHGTHYMVSTVSPSAVVIGHAECPRRERYVRHYIGQSNEQFSGNCGVFMQLVPLSRAPGNIVDWMYKKMGVKYSFAAHLRDTGTVSFNPKFQARKTLQLNLFSVWVFFARAMDTTCWRRNFKDDRILGRFYLGRWQRMPLNHFRVQTRIMTVLVFLQPSSQSGGLC